MEPTFFYFFVLPLAGLIVLLVGLVLYLARKGEESLYVGELKKLRKMLTSGTIDKKTFERMRNRLREESIFTEELESLNALLQDKTIDQDAYVRIREMLEKAFRQRVDALSGYVGAS